MMTLRQILGRRCQDRNTERKKREGKGGEREEVDRRRKGERRECWSKKEEVGIDRMERIKKGAK